MLHIARGIVLVLCDMYCGTNAVLNELCSILFSLDTKIFIIHCLSDFKVQLIVGFLCKREVY